jgi:ornithine cyclodeaminase
MVARGAHINASGASTPERMQIPPPLFDRCTVATTDSVDAARRLSRECMAYFGESAAGWERLRPLCQIVATQTHRPADCDLTLLKSMGSGIADVALGIEIMRRLGGENP